MYEQPGPFELHEPEGVVDLADARFTQLDARTDSAHEWRPRQVRLPRLVDLQDGGHQMKGIVREISNPRSLRSRAAVSYTNEC